ncbi:MAG: hypothetical protein PHR82_08980 [Endomicrobiaceae bacterium]|nr:hypothetical protein [Endomicrobiaceae bacterium]
MRYNKTRAELKNDGALNYKDGDVIKCGKYYIWIKYGDYKTPSLLTRVNTEETLIYLPLSKWPQYISDFIRSYNIDMEAE